jgi:hypothetical protein
MDNKQEGIKMSKFDPEKDRAEWFKQMMDAEMIRLGIEVAERNPQAKYPIVANIHLSMPGNPLVPTTLLTTALFKEPDAAMTWGRQVVDILGEDQAWLELRKTDFDRWMMANLPPDDFERDHAH